MKVCRRCKERKPNSEFYKNKRTPDGLSIWCKTCTKVYGVKSYNTHREKKIKYARSWRRANPEKVKAFRKRWQKANPKKIHETERRYALKKNYGLTLKDYARMFKAQGEVCAICGEPERERKYLSVDHDHFTEKVRGLICTRCNRALGFADDSPAKLRKMAIWIEKHLLTLNRPLQRPFR